VQLFVCGFVQENNYINDLNLGWTGIGPQGATSIADMLKVGLICYMFCFARSYVVLMG